MKNCYFSLDRGRKEKSFGTPQLYHQQQAKEDILAYECMVLDLEAVRKRLETLREPVFTLRAALFQAQPTSCSTEHSLEQPP